MPEVLIVDDDPDIRGMLAFLLGDDGFSVREAKDGADVWTPLGLADGLPFTHSLSLNMMGKPPR